MHIISNNQQLTGCTAVLWKRLIGPYLPYRGILIGPGRSPWVHTEDSSQVGLSWLFAIVPKFLFQRLLYLDLRLLLTYQAFQRPCASYWGMEEQLVPSGSQVSCALGSFTWPLATATSSPPAMWDIFLEMYGHPLVYQRKQIAALAPASFGGSLFKNKYSPHHYVILKGRGRDTTRGEECEHTHLWPACFPFTSHLLHSFQLLECKFFPPRAIVYVTFSVQNGLYAPIIEDSFSPQSISSGFSWERPSLATFSRKQPPLLFPFHNFLFSIAHSTICNCFNCLFPCFLSVVLMRQ